LLSSSSARFLTRRGRILAVLAAGALVTLRPAAAARGAGGTDRVAEVTESLAAVVPGADRQEVAALARLMVTDPRSPELPRKLAPLLSKTARATREQVAGAIEAPGNSLAYELAGGRDLRKWLSVEGKAGNQGASLGAGASAGPILSSVSINADPNSRSVSATFDLGAACPKASQIEVHKVLRVKFTYKDNHDYLMALTPIPGREATLSVMDLFRPGTQDLHPQGPKSKLPPTPMRAAWEAATRAAVPNADRFTNVESMTFGTGVDIVYQGSERPEAHGAAFAQGSVTLSYSDMERLAPGQRPGEGVRYADVSLGLGFKGGAKTYTGGVNLSIGHTTDPQAQTRDPNLETIAQLVRDGRPITEAATGTMSLLRDPEGVRKGLQQLLKGAAQGIDGADRLYAVTDPAVGGVRVYYDPALLGAAVPPGEVVDLLRELVKNEQAGRKSFALRRTAGEETFVTLSLKEWQETESPTLGDLTRVRGYIVTPDDVVLIGQSEPDRPPIDADLLTVALNAVYRDGTMPFVSLDPDPKNPAGRQVPRVGGLPEQFRESEFVRVMLDADYDMKRINLGELKPDLPGFRSWYEILRRTSAFEPGLRRSWLTPVSAGAGDVLEHGPAVLFGSGVKVLSEGMHQIEGCLVPTGQTSPEDLEAASQLTQYYPQIEQKLESFYRLHGLFDVTKLCALLRYRDVHSPVLDAIAGRPVRTVAPQQPDRTSVLDPYQGIGPKQVEGTTIWISGGVELQAHLGPEVFARSEALGELLQGKTTLTLERVTPLPGAAVADLLVRSAARDFVDDRFREAVAECTQALREAPDLPAGHFLRGLARFSMGQPREALPDLDAMVETQPRFFALRALVKLTLDDAEGARRDADEAMTRCPGLAPIGWANAWVKLLSGDFAGAEGCVRELEVFDPQGTLVPAFRDALAELRGLKPAEAKRQIAEALRLPFALSRAMVQGDAARRTDDTQAARARLGRALRLAEALADHPAVRSDHTRERVLMLLAMTETGEGTPSRPSVKDPAAGIAYADRLIALRPRWASGYLTKAYGSLWLPGGGRPAVVKALITRAVALRSAPDPLMDYWQTLFGTGSALPRNFYGMALLAALEKNRDPRLYLDELAKASPLNARGVAALRRAGFPPPARGSRPRRKLSAAQRKATLARLRPAVTAALRGRTGNDLGSVMLRIMLLGCRAEMEEAAGRPGASLRASRAFLRDVPANPPGEAARGACGIFCVRMLRSTARDAEESSRRDAELNRLIAQVARGEAPLSALRDRAVALADAARQEPGPSDAPFVRALVGFNRELMPLTLEAWALDEATRKPGASSSTGSSEIDARRQELQQQRLEFWATVETRLDDWLAKAQTPVDVATLKAFVEDGVFWVTYEVKPDAEAAARLQHAVDVVAAKSQHRLQEMLAAGS
jgi:tetratricopeptide (TPR) repeat protein